MTDYGSIIQSMDNIAPTQAVTSLDENPDDGARALQLSKATGVAPQVIHGDLDGFEQQHRAGLTSQIVRGNASIANYIRQNPLANVVSNDDYGNLDNFSRSVPNVGWLDSKFGKYIAEPTYAGIKGAVIGAKEAFTAPYREEDVDKYLTASYPQRLAYSAADIGIRLMNALGGATFGGAGAFAEQEARAITGSEEQASRAGREVRGILESEMGRAAEHLPSPELVEGIKAQQAAAPWIKAGVEPPRGLHPLIDQTKAELNFSAVEMLDKNLADAQTSLTHDRSPELFQKFAEQHYGDSTISISGDRVAELYGDRIPDPDDGLLGWVPGIEAKLEAARITGDDVHLPLADLMTKIDPALFKELKPDLRVWPGGITKTEAKEPWESKPVVDSPMAQARDASGTEPMFAIGDRKLELKQAPSIFSEIHEYQFHDQAGKPVGELSIIPDPETKTLFVANINGLAGLYSNSFGPSLVRELKRQLKGIYPDFEWITGHRVSGAREAAGTQYKDQFSFPKVRLALDETENPQSFKDFHDILERKAQQHFGSGIYATHEPTEFLSAQHADIAQAIDETVRRVAGIEPTVVSDINMEGVNRTISGMYIPYEGRDPVMLIDLFSVDPIGFGRHEAIHHLARSGFFKPEEWSALTAAAKSEGWLDRYGIKDRYGDQPEHVQIEESIAEAYRDWGRAKDEVPQPTTLVTQAFEKLSQLWEGIKTRFKEMFGRELNPDELFRRVESGEIAGREGKIQAGEPRFALGEDEIKARMDNLRAGAHGLDLKTFKNIQKAVQARFQEDIQASLKRAEAEQKRTQTKEWKEQSKELAKQVEQTIRQRPDVMVDLLVGSGEFMGEKLRQRYPLRVDDLTAEQKAGLPRHYYSKDGLPIDGVAKMVGFPSGDLMVQDLIEYNKGKGNLSAQEMLRKTIDDETARQMEAKRGKLQDNIMLEAQDQALSENNLNILAEEWQGAAMKAGISVVDKDFATAEAKRMFNNMKVGEIDSQRFMTQMLKHSKDIEKDLINGDSASAVTRLQRRYMVGVWTAEAKKLEKEQAAFDRIAKPYAKRWDPTAKQTVDPDFSIFTRDILAKIDRKNGLSGPGLDKAIQESRFTDLNDFISKTENEHRLEGLELPVPDFLLNKDYRTSTDKMSVEEFRQVSGAVKALDTVGKAFRKVIIGGETEDLSTWMGMAKDQIEGKFPILKQRLGKPSMPKDALNKSIATSTNMETLFGRFDSRDPHGLFTETFIYPAFEASGGKAKLEKEMGKEFKGLGEIKDPEKIIDSPFQWKGQPVEFTRRNLQVVISNMGNDYNFKTMAKGWGIEPDALWDWAVRNSTPEDFHRAQKLSTIFNELKSMDDANYRRRYGVAPENITIRPFEAHGEQFPGWYHPIIGDKERSRFVNKLDTSEDWGFWPSTSNSFMKRRTGALQVIDLTYDSVPARISQMIHDISFRDFVGDSAKIIKDNRFRELVTTRYGKDYLNEIDGWINRIAGQSSHVSDAMAMANKVSSAIRSNVISTQIAFNLGTVEKHGLTAWLMSAREMGPNVFVTVPKFAYVFGEVQADRFKNAVQQLYINSPQVGDSIYKFCVDSSEELQRRDRNILETAVGQQALFERGAWYTRLRAEISRYGAKAVAWSDMLSAVPLWWAKYQDEFAVNGAHGDAIRVADAAVRRAHGSVAEANLPSIAAGNNPVTPWLTSLYGFMGTSMQRRIEIFHDLNDAYNLGKAGEIKEATANFGRAMSSLAVYVVYTGLVEEAVTSQFTDDKRGLGMKATSALFGMTANSIIGIRDLVHDFEYGTESAGLISTPIHDAMYFTRDLIKNKPLSKDHAGRLVQDGITALGDFSGMGPKHIGTLARYGIDVFNQYQRPRTGADIYRGVVSGSQKLHEKR